MKSDHPLSILIRKNSDRSKMTNKAENMNTHSRKKTRMTIHKSEAQEII